MNDRGKTSGDSNLGATGPGSPNRPLSPNRYENSYQNDGEQTYRFGNPNEKYIRRSDRGREWPLPGPNPDRRTTSQQTPKRSTDWKRIPYGLTYSEGPGWEGFKNKLIRYLGSHEIFDDEQKVQTLSLCLTGKASEVFERNANRYEYLTFETHLEELGDVLNEDRLTPDEAFSKVQSMEQNPDESAREFMMRLREMTLRALPELDIQEVQRHIVMRFCTALIDKDAAQYVLINSDRTVKDALRLYERFTQSRQIVRPEKKQSNRDAKHANNIRQIKSEYKDSTPRYANNVRYEQSSEDESDAKEEPHDRRGESRKVRFIDPSKQSGEDPIAKLLEKMNKNQEKMNENLECLNKTITSLATDIKETLSVSKEAAKNTNRLSRSLQGGNEKGYKSRSPSPGRLGRSNSRELVCWDCQLPGHFRGDERCKGKVEKNEM